MDSSPTPLGGEASSAPAPVEKEHTIGSYFDAFGPVPAWERLIQWPADVWCLCSLVLDHTEAYRFAVAPPAGRRWPPASGWNASVGSAAHAWAQGEVPFFVRHRWAVLSRHRDTPLSVVRSGSDWELCEALLTLHAIADEAHAMLAAPEPPGAALGWVAEAWELLTRTGTLSNVPSHRVRVLPKTNFATRGMTIRQLSRYLALCYESVDVRWSRMEPEPHSPQSAPRGRPFSAMLVPWPRTIRTGDFHPIPGPLENMDAETFGFFEFAPRESLSADHVGTLLEVAIATGDTVDAMILPEAALASEQVPAFEDVLDRFGVRLLIAGTRRSGDGHGLGRNYVHFGARTSLGWQRLEQDKHHRWLLDGSQIQQYHLGGMLDPMKSWWEGIDLPARSLNVIDVGGGATAVPLVCEDLARMDEVADLLRRIGPSIVVAVLLDGPQLTNRWPCRYAAVLADEPGSSVLTLSAYGMVRRSRPEGMPASRVIALWSDRASGIREISLGPGAQAVLLQTMVRPRTTWTADGRRHDGVPEVVLTGLRQIRAARFPVQGRGVGQHAAETGLALSAGGRRTHGAPTRSRGG